MNRIVLILCFALISPLLPSKKSAPSDQGQPSSHASICNQDGSLCVRSALQNSLVRDPFYFEVQVHGSDPVNLNWQLRDDAGRILDEDARGELAFLVKRSSASERTLGVRDFAVAPAKSSRGKLILHATAYSTGHENRTLPELSIPVRFDRRTVTVTYAVPADKEAFHKAVIDAVEADPSHRVPLVAPVHWQTKSLLYVRPGMLGGAAAEMTARALESQGKWHIIQYRTAGTTAHITRMGGGWAGVTYYLMGLDYLVKETALHQPGVRHVVFDPRPDFGQ